MLIGKLTQVLLVIGLVTLLPGCGGIRPPGMLSISQIEALANKVDNPDDPEAIWADNISEEQWALLKRFIAIYNSRIGYRRGWRDGWDAKGEQIRTEEIQNDH